METKSLQPGKEKFRLDIRKKNVLMNKSHRDSEQVPQKEVKEASVQKEWLH